MQDIPSVNENVLYIWFRYFPSKHESVKCARKRPQPFSSSSSGLSQTTLYKVQKLIWLDQIIVSNEWKRRDAIHNTALVRLLDISTGM